MGKESYLFIEEKPFWPFRNIPAGEECSHSATDFIMGDNL
jgi:hypothetical protein